MRLRKFLLKAPKGIAKSLRLRRLIFELLREACNKLLLLKPRPSAVRAKSSGLLLNSEFGLPIPLVHGILMLLQFFLAKGSL
jgi:hypothetical protein